MCFFRLPAEDRLSLACGICDLPACVQPVKQSKDRKKMLAAISPVPRFGIQP